MELYLEPIRPKYNPKNGRFLKGNVPHNKGKKWTDYMDMRKARKVKRIGMMNLRGRSDIGGWNKRQVIGIKNGQFFVFESATKAAKILEIERRNISHCCKGKRKHCGGFRWFFEKDYHLWKNLI
jgi:hypothetical protein